MSKTLIAYFSRADENYFGGAMRYIKVGNTEIAVGKIRELIDADTFKIEMKEPYSPVYMTCIDEAKKDLRAKARPALGSWRISTFPERRSFRSAPMKAAVWAAVREISKISAKVRS